MMGDSTEEESKVDVKEASANLNCVTNEFAEEVVKLEENLHVTQYRVTTENIFEVALVKRNFEEYDDKLIGFLNNDAIMENVVIKLEGIKEDDGNFKYCNMCNGDYKGFCLKCSTLSHILNNTSPPTSLESEINTVPKDILEIRDFPVEKGVFVLKTLPQNIIFGPFEGMSAIRNSNGDCWKINNKRLENVENRNWMKDIACARSVLTKNLDAFQMKENLYFQTNREIMEGEELLVYYDDEELIKMDDCQENYFIPRMQEDLPKIFACTLCCLGFQLVRCLVEHKSKCPHAEHNTDIKDFELVECHCCNIWLEKQEYQEYHMDYCWEKHMRLSYVHAQPVDRNQVNVEKVENGVNRKAVHGGFKCSQCSYETNYKRNLQRHLNKHEKLFQCDICKMNFTLKDSLNRHIKNKHGGNECPKDYQCSECSFQTNYKYYFQEHLNGHRGIKPFECDICKMKFTQKGSLKRHIKDKHTENGGAKDYQCSECNYQTNYKTTYQDHLNVHRGIKAFECDICKMKFTQKSHLKTHIKNKHLEENGDAKDYQCSECTYQTNRKRTYHRHLNGHRGIKAFKCGICKKEFTLQGNLKFHVKTIHTDNGNAFKCDICKKNFTRKGNLNCHIKTKHTESKI